MYVEALLSLLVVLLLARNLFLFNSLGDPVALLRTHRPFHSMPRVRLLTSTSGSAAAEEEQEGQPGGSREAELAGGVPL